MAKVITNVGTIVPITPATESQTRPLARLEPEQQAYQDRVMDALARYEKTRSRKTGTGRKGKS